VLLYRVTHHNPPTLDDMKSYWDLGRRPPLVQLTDGYKRDDERAYKGVSTFDTRERMAAKARALALGEFVAELDVPASVELAVNPRTGHTRLHGTTPEQLIGYVRNVWQVDDAG